MDSNKNSRKNNKEEIIKLNFIPISRKKYYGYMYIHILHESAVLDIFKTQNSTYKENSCDENFISTNFNQYEIRLKKKQLVIKIKVGV